MELALSQRYSAEYYVVTSVPVAFMAAAAAGSVWRHLLSTRVPAQQRSWWCRSSVAVAAVGLSGMKNFDNDVRSAWNFRGFDANANRVALDRRGVERSAQAVLDLVSHNGDPLLVWTNDPWPYLNFDRVPATRFFYKSFLLGEIYQGRTSTAYVLPDTWKWFAQDLRQSDPVAYVRADEPNLPGGNPFATYVAQNFDLVLPDANLPVSLRHDAARQVLIASGTQPWRGQRPPVSHSGWTLHGSTASYVEGPVPSSQDQLTLSTTSCFRLDGTIAADGSHGIGTVGFYFDDNTGKTQQMKLAFAGTYATSATDYNDFQREPTHVPAGARRRAVLDRGRPAFGRARGQRCGAGRAAAPAVGDGQRRPVVTHPALHEPARRLGADGERVLSAVRRVDQIPVGNAAPLGAARSASPSIASQRISAMSCTRTSSSLPSPFTPSSNIT